jgi:predicted DsbA family dithiol-disulfide isomerase
MTTHLKIDFVSDVACPWCVIGLRGLSQALDSLAGEVEAEIHFQPFELNPGMGAEGEEIVAHLTRKYGISVEQMKANRDAIAARGASLGFKFSGPDAPGGGRHHVYNTFDAHRLLHWAGEESPTLQRALKEALFKAYFTDGRNPASTDVLLDVVGEAGLDTGHARRILQSDEYADAVREREAWFTGRGIRAVPAVIINDRHLISGGQPPEAFAEALRRIAAEADEAAEA